MREAFVGFDSAWTGKKTGGLASVSLKPDEEPQVDLVHKPLPNFETAAKRISDLISSHDYVLAAIDQPTIVPNLSNSRPVDRVAASLMSSLRSGAQPANRGKKTMFGNDAPIWKFLEEIGARENPVAAQTESKGLFLIEVFPALALPALRPYFYYRGNAARYNPDKKEMFRIRDWKLVAQTVEHHSERQGLLPLASWARCLVRPTISVDNLLGRGAPGKERAMSTRKQDRGRFSSKRKMEAVVRLLGGADLDLLSRELGVTAGKLSEWRDAFLASGQAGLKSRPGDGRDEEIRALKAMVGDLTMRLELSQEAVRRMKGYAPPFVPRRPTR